MFEVKPKKYSVKFRYEKPIKGIIQTEFGYRIIEAYDIIDAIMIIKDDGAYKEVSEPVVYEVSEVTDGV